MSDGRGVMDLICDFTYVWILVFSIAVILVLLSLFSFAFVTPGTTPYYLTIVNLVMLVPLAIVLYVVIDRCESSI